jgi:hypothetical protein
MSRFRHPDGSRLPALERNILKYRAFEMVLMLYYAEEMKRFVIGLIDSSDSFRDDDKRRVHPGVKLDFKGAMDALFKEGVVSDDERKEIKKLVDFRNDIAHQMPQLTFDISRSTFIRETRQFMESRYDHDALRRIKLLRRELSDRAQSKFVFRSSYDPILFESAEKTYEAEIKRLRAKIDKQYAVRKRKIGLLNEELSLDGLPEDLYPYHPLNEKRNGNLSKRGIEVCYRLFDAGKSPLAVGYLMHISRKAANQHRKRWIKAGGADRVKTDLEALSKRPPRRLTKRSGPD